MLIELGGTHYEMGKRHGQKLIRYRPALSDLLEAHRKRTGAYSQETLHGLLQEVRDVLSTHSPQTLDLFLGITNGFGFPQQGLLSMMLGSYYEDRLPSAGPKIHETECTTWAYSSEEGLQRGILLAKNRDYLISHRALQVVFRCRPEKGNEYFSVNSIGAPMVFSSGMNEEGLAIADTRVPSFDAGPGLPRFTLMMHILENFKTVSEALDYLKSVPRMGGGNLVFADAEGMIGSAEVGHHGLDTVSQARGYLVCTNHFKGPAMQKQYRQVDTSRREDSRWRSEETLRRLSQWSRGANLDQAKGLMAAHGREFSICVHRGLNPSDETATLSSTLFLPKEKGFYFCEGFPCTTPYEWISFAS